MNIIGIGGYSHDSAAALVCDGKLAAAVAEERLTRIKHQGGSPRRAVAYCLESAGLKPDDVDHIACYMRPGLRMRRRLLYRMLRFPQAPLFSLGYGGYEFLHNAQFAWDMRRLCGKHTQLHFLEHHPAHAASAFLVSPFDSAALLSVDYVGEWATTWAGRGQETRIDRQFSLNYPHSLGVFYSGITDYLGFVRASDEYKVMGLASYGEPEFEDEFRRIVRISADGQFRLDLSWFQAHLRPGSRYGYFSHKFVERFGPPRRKDEPIEPRHRNIAASAQRVLEEAVLAMAHRLHRETGERRLCLAGGVALNCAMNGRLLREGPFEEIWVQPAAGDDGIAIGGAFRLYHHLTRSERTFEMRHALFGPEYTNDAIRRVLEMAKLTFEVTQHPAKRAAELIAEGLIVGWYQGRMEFGPRALGARSILADPTRPEMQDLINKYVKHREEFRPFAPSVLKGRAHEYFEGCHRSPFMLFVYRVKDEMKSRIPAVTHVDGTARVQTVSRQTQPKYYALIEEFEKLRGVPAVLNTSFNVMGEPIVNTPADAIRCFYSTGLDALVIGDYVVRKR